MKHWKIIVIVLTSILLYSNTINHGFVLDDNSAIVDNRIVKRGIEGLYDIFTTHYRAGYWSNYGDLYRPLPLASFAIEYQFSRGNPLPHHLINIVFYVLIGLVLFSLLGKWFSKKNAFLPLLITLLYLFHPIHTEVVANIKSRDELMSFFFVLFAFHAYHRFITTRHTVYLILMCFVFFLALLSKEGSIAFMLVMPLAAYFIYDQKPKELVRIFFFACVPLVGFLFMRHIALSGQSGVAEVSTESMITLFAAHPFDKLTKAGYHLLLYAGKLLIPYPLASNYPELFGKTTGFVISLGIIGLLTHLALLVFGIKWFLRKQWIGFLILFYLITHFLHSNLFLIIGTNFGERLLFLPSLAFSIATGLFITKVSDRVNQNYFWIITGVVLVVYGALTITRNQDWKSNRTLYAADVKTQPECANLNYWYALDITNSHYLATLEKDKKRESLEEGLIYFKKAISLNKNFGDAIAQVALVYYKLGMNEKALENFKKAITIGKGSVETLNNVAVIYFEKGNFEMARKYYEMAVEKDPFYTDAWGNLGATNAQMGNFKTAEKAFKKAIELRPGNAHYKFYMGMTLNELGRVEEAKTYFDQAFALDPKLKR